MAGGGAVSGGKAGGGETRWAHLRNFFARAAKSLINPLLIGIFLGTVLAAAKVELPPFLLGPIQGLADAAVPLMLMAFGISLRGAKLPRWNGQGRAALLASGVKLLVAPALAWVLGYLVFDLHGAALLAPLMTASMPTAQNVFIYAVRYEKDIALARDTVLITTVTCMFVVIAIAACFL